MTRTDLDIPCHCCGEYVTEPGISSPATSDDKHTAAVLRELRKRGWRGSRISELVCPGCRQKQTRR